MKLPSYVVVSLFRICVDRQQNTKRLPKKSELCGATHSTLQKNMTYREAIEELETILRALETDAVDVDDLTTRVERSAELIRLCRHKLRHAEASLDRVFDSLDEDEEEDDDEADTTDDATETDDDTDETDEDDEHDHLPGGPGRAW